jgi:hypothetical protein
MAFEELHCLLILLLRLHKRGPEKPQKSSARLPFQEFYQVVELYQVRQLAQNNYRNLHLNCEFCIFESDEAPGVDGWVDLDLDLLGRWCREFLRLCYEVSLAGTMPFQDSDGMRSVSKFPSRNLPLAATAVEYAEEHEQDSQDVESNKDREGSGIVFSFHDITCYVPNQNQASGLTTADDNMRWARFIFTFHEATCYLIAVPIQAYPGRCKR